MPDQNPLSTAENLNTNTWDNPPDVESNGIQAGAEKPLEMAERPRQPEAGAAPQAALDPKILTPETPKGPQTPTIGASINLGGNGLDKTSMKKVKAAERQFLSGAVSASEYYDMTRETGRDATNGTWGENSSWKAAA